MLATQAAFSDIAHQAHSTDNAATINGVWIRVVAWPFWRWQKGFHWLVSHQIENDLLGLGGSGDLGSRISTVQPAFGLL